MAELLHIVQKIDLGLRDSETMHPDFRPLWDHPLLRESMLAMLQDNAEFQRKNFKIIAELFAPEILTSAMVDRVMKEGGKSVRV